LLREAEKRKGGANGKSKQGREYSREDLRKARKERMNEGWMNG
jgi:hypothetical protein